MTGDQAAPRTASFKGFARILGERSPSYVTELKAAGRLVLTADGKQVLIDDSLALLRETADPAAEAVVARHAANRAQRTAAAPASTQAGRGDDEVDEDAPVAPLADPVAESHARRKAKAQADKAETDATAAERDLRLSMGQLREASAVMQAVAAAGAVLRTSLESLPSTMAPELAATADEGKVRSLLHEAIEHALDEVSRQFAALAKAEAE